MLFIFGSFFSSPSCLSKYGFSENTFKHFLREWYCKQWLRLSILLFLLTNLLGNRLPFMNFTLITFFDNEIHKNTDQSLLLGLIRRVYRNLGFLKQICTISELMIPVNLALMYINTWNSLKFCESLNMFSYT